MTEQPITLKLALGALFPTIAVQLTEQKFKFNEKKAKEFEELRSSILTLHFSEIINDKAYDQAKKKLFSMIRKHVMQQGKLKLPGKIKTGFYPN